MSKSLALVWRPKTFDDVTEQGSVKAILQNQLEKNEIRNGYIFVGAAGTGKTTCARIFANEINKGQGNPIEMDAASNNGVDDVRELEKMAQTRSITSEYKVIILDEVHMFSAGAWAAMLKLIEEPPAKTIFILCTTDYWKIPKTIQSRCQRFNFKRISTDGIVSRLSYICGKERVEQLDDSLSALDLIARQSDGCLREAITNLDKCLSYSEQLTVDNTIAALGLSDYDTFMDLTDALLELNNMAIIDIVERVYADGQDMRQFIKQYMDFVLDIIKYSYTKDIKYTSLPSTKEMIDWLNATIEWDCLPGLFEKIMRIDNEIKWSQSPKTVIEAELLA